MFVLKEAAIVLSDVTAFDDFVKSVKITSIQYASTRDLNIFEVGSSKTWKVEVNPPDNVIAFVRDGLRIITTRRDMKSMTADDSHITFDMKSGAKLRAFYEKK